MEEPAVRQREPDWSALLDIYEEALEVLHTLDQDTAKPLKREFEDRYGEVVLERHLRDTIL